MASPQDVQTPPSSTIDPHHFTQFHPNDPHPTFNPMAPSHSDPSLPSTSAAHVHSAMTAMFQTELEHTHAVVPMQMSLPPMQHHGTNMSSMDVVPATSVDSAATQGLLSDYAAQNGSFGVDFTVNGLEGLDGSHQLVSSPSATTASTNASHASSPAVNGMASSYSVGSSSLASALDGMGAARSRSDSSASPPTLLSSSSDLGFSSSSSGPPTSAHENSFPYGISPDSQQQTKEPSPEQSGSAHLLVLGSMLQNIARQANSGSQACNMGSTTDAQQIVDVLKKNVLLVADLVAALQIADGLGPSSSSQSSPLSHSGIGPDTNAMTNVSTASAMDVGPQHISSLSSYSSSSASLDPNAMLDSSDMSRKRCASSVAGDRALKTLKLEPQDDPPPTMMQTSSGLSLSSSLPSSSGFPFTLQMPTMQPSVQSMGDISSIPPLMASGSNSRPPSSAGMPPPHQLGLVSEAQQASLSLQSSMHYPAMDHTQQPVHPAPDFASSAPTAVPPTSLPSTSFNPTLPWADVPVTRHHHQHSLSTGSVLTGIPESGGPSSIHYTAHPTFNSPTRATHLQQGSVPGAVASTSVHPSSLHSVRSSRSSSFAHPSGEIHPLANAYDLMRPSTSGLPSRVSSPDYDEMDIGRESDDESGEPSPGHYRLSPAGNAGDSSETRANGASNQSGQRRMSRGSPSAEGGSASGHGNEVPQEYRAEVERIFFEFLNNTCSNLDATDTKGEPIHQTLMAKKMQRLDESPDYRPFKFRIQAFTNAFLEELARQGYPEEKIPMKKIRNFLWNQPYISRFNEDGKKSKSKGNHIWHVDAKKSEGGWMFRPFRRKLAGTPPGVAYVGLRWSWTPRIWDPQASRSNMPVHYSSPLLPSWLSWKDDVLSGIPTPEAQSCDVTVEARFLQDGQEEILSHTVHVTIAPMASVDSTFTPSRRPSLVGDVHNPRRILSDSMVGQTAPPRLMRAQSTIAPVAPVVAPDSQVVQVLTTAAQRVAQEAQSQVVASPNDAGPELQALAKQQHVLTVTAQAFNSKMAGEGHDGSGSQSNALTAAAQQVVLQAARQVAADRTVAAVSSGMPSSPSTVASQVTVKDVSVATQSAVAQAVDMVGPLSSEVDVLMTASSLLQQQTRLPSQNMLDSQLAASDPNRTLASVTAPPQYGMPLSNSVPVFFHS